MVDRNQIFVQKISVYLNLHCLRKLDHQVLVLVCLNCIVLVLLPSVLEVLLQLVLIWTTDWFVFVEVLKGPYEQVELWLLFIYFTGFVVNYQHLVQALHDEGCNCDPEKQNEWTQSSLWVWSRMVVPKPYSGEGSKREVRQHCHQIWIAQLLEAKIFNKVVMSLVKIFGLITKYEPKHSQIVTSKQQEGDELYYFESVRQLDDQRYVSVVHHLTLR